MSDEFDALLAETQLEREKADGIRSLDAASKLAAGYQARAEKAEAEVARLRAGREIEQAMLANVLPTLAANDAENEALRAEVASLRAFQLQPRAALEPTP